ncbi:MAG: hypothetical protein AAF629_08585 [Chloroflexota bacterium]
MHLELDGKNLKNITDVIDALCKQCPGCASAKVKNISSLRDFIADKMQAVEIRWHNADLSKVIMVRKSDIPLDKLPKDGSNMMRDIILDLVYEEISLYEKVVLGFSLNENITIIDL